MPRHTTLAVLGAALAAGLTACSSSTTSVSAPAPTSSAAAPTSSAPASPSAPASTASSGSASLAAWYSTTGKDVVTNLGTEAKQLNADKQSPDDLSFDCVSIDNTEQDAEKQPAPPDASIATAWKAALQQIRQGWWDCNGGKTTVGTTEIGTGVTELGAVDSEIRSKIHA